MFSLLRTALLLFLALTVLTGGIYPLIVTAVAQVAFPHAANGSLIVPQESSSPVDTAHNAETNRYDWNRPDDSALSRGPMPAGSELIGQPFTKPEYFWGRLSATAPVPYNAAASSGSNFGPLHPALKDAAAARVSALQIGETRDQKVPVELVTASGSGLDPHISPAAAEFQAPRIAAARNMKQFAVRELIRQLTEHRQFGVLGEPRVNVLRLNLALDRQQHES